ncbi:hypothetical protein FB566_2739 [Stackebrandtia endophytica]|uniref:Lipoprotein n=1 Tax=Stackebrandtia endophytica TaxID=1496996 RepID=A0A543AX84_9ACTN|nr:hypothetical protein [Stackebrandtia endophytica]TQL77188.1 hypothetical protein FB566_2739 [Stackebrandtia endophytica]
MVRFPRIAAAVAGGALVLAGMTACSQVNDAVDCVKVVPAVTEVSQNVTGDTETLTASTAELRTVADGISDENLKQAVLDYAEQAETANALLNGDAAAVAEADTQAVEEAFTTLTDICGSLAG